MATIKDIAERAGVSIGTVDRIIHERGRFASETAQRVRRIMADLEYRPNLMARHLSQARTYRVCVLLPWPEQDSRYWAMPLDGVRRAEDELRPFSLGVSVFHFDRYSPESFVDAGRDLLAERPDAMVMAPLRHTEARAMLADVDRDTPVVFIDTDLSGVNRFTYIGQDSYQSGQLAARLMGLLTGSVGRTLIIAPETENEHLDNRIRGFTEHTAIPAEVTRVSIELNHDRDSFARQLSEALKTDATGVFVVDASSHYAAEYLAERDRGRDRPRIVGYDLVPENRRWLAGGGIDVLLTQRPSDQGYRAVQALYRRLFFDEACPDHIHTPIDIVLKENLAYFSEKETL